MKETHRKEMRRVEEKISTDTNRKFCTTCQSYRVYDSGQWTRTLSTSVRKWKCYGCFHKMRSIKNSDGLPKASTTEPSCKSM